MGTKLDYCDDWDDTEKNVGEYVYRPYSPNNIGKIIKVVPDKQIPELPAFEVKWSKPLKNGKTVDVHPHYLLNSLQALIDDHKKKVKTHTKALAEAKKKLED